ncbi:hypothetical protein DPMN_130930 [Dreissena polymorpha]|uniref:Uncharacterized protein n=1 Tax=Dreissena polymorpha TaxID=45954 RepID=A0A9D4H8N2_DREPO|nr:hypothetical protein DPMN_130930 [Dreissena polymorpha]
MIKPKFSDEYGIDLKPFKHGASLHRLFKSRIGYSRHIRQHNGQAPYRCCGKNVL